MSMRLELIHAIADEVESRHGAKSRHRTDAKLLHDIRDHLNIPASKETRTEIMTAIVDEGIIDTNQSYYSSDPTFGVDELQQLHEHLKSLA